MVIIAGLLSAITTVFTSILDWIIQGMQSVVSLFWATPSGGTAPELTFYGILAVCGLCVSIVFLVIGIAQKFLHFAG